MLENWNESRSFRNVIPLLQLKVICCNTWCEWWSAMLGREFCWDCHKGPVPSLQVWWCKWYWMITMTYGGFAGNLLVIVFSHFYVLKGNSYFKSSNGNWEKNTYFMLKYLSSHCFAFLNVRYPNSRYCEGIFYWKNFVWKIIKSSVQIHHWELWNLLVLSLNPSSANRLACLLNAVSLCYTD